MSAVSAAAAVETPAIVDLTDPELFRCALRLASVFEIFSPVYSAILCLFLKEIVAKQPLPCIGEGLIARPCASFIT